MPFTETNTFFIFTRNTPTVNSLCIIFFKKGMYPPDFAFQWISYFRFFLSISSSFFSNSLNLRSFRFLLLNLIHFLLFQLLNRRIFLMVFFFSYSFEMKTTFRNPLSFREGRNLFGVAQNVYTSPTLTLT